MFRPDLMIVYFLKDFYWEKKKKKINQEITHTKNKRRKETTLACEPKTSSRYIK